MTHPTDFDFDALEVALTEECLLALEKLGRKRGLGPVRALALHEVYRELDGPIALPMLAVDIAREADAEARWSPPDWAFPELPLRKRTLAQLARALERHATSGSQAHWRRVERRVANLLIRVVRRLRDQAPTLLETTPNFVAFWDDAEGGPELMQKTIPARLRETLGLAPAQAAPARRRRGVTAAHVEALAGLDSDAARAALVSLGGRAAPALLGVLDDPERGWQAARVLGELPRPTPVVIEALRARAADGGWCARALGNLGDLEWLAEQPVEVATAGLAAALPGEFARRRPLDYAPLEGYLDGLSTAARRRAERALMAMGTGEIVVDDVDEAIRGLGSRFSSLRRHAASVLGERGLGRAAGKRILPALAGALRDRSVKARRTALVSLMAWKSAARPFSELLEPLRADPDPAICVLASRFLNGG